MSKQVKTQCDQLINVHIVKGVPFGECSWVKNFPWTVTDSVPTEASNIVVTIRDFAKIEHGKVTGLMFRGGVPVLGVEHAQASCSATGLCEQQMKCSRHQLNRKEF